MLVRRERNAEGRRERYVVDDDVWIRAWMASARKNATWADAAQQGAEILGATTPAGARLTDMGRFFAQLASDMTGGPTGTAVDDALTVLVALVHTTARLAPDQLATALGWPPDRVTTALREARPDRLTAAQRRPSTVDTTAGGDHAEAPFTRWVDERRGQLRAYPRIPV